MDFFKDLVVFFSLLKPSQRKPQVLNIYKHVLYIKIYTYIFYLIY